MDDITPTHTHEDGIRSGDQFTPDTPVDQVDTVPAAATDAEQTREYTVAFLSRMPEGSPRNPRRFVTVVETTDEPSAVALARGTVEELYGQRPYRLESVKEAPNNGEHAPGAADQGDPGPDAEALADVDQGDAVSIYGAPVDWYTPELKSDGPDDATDITIRHDHENGTVMEGGRKGDGTLEIVQVYRFKWRRGAGVHIPHSRDRFADLVSIEKAAEALRAAGHTVTVEIDDVWRPASVREDARGRRAGARVERLTERAGGAYAKAEARRLAARNIADGMPFGEPIKVGHHSERAHRRAFERIDANDRASYAARDYAEHLASRAAGAESNEAAKHNPRAIMRRIETLEAEGRKWARYLADPETGDGWRRRSTLEAEKIAEDVAYQRAKLGDMAAAGAFVAWSGKHFQRGDWANVSGRWCEVARVNPKGVSVYDRFDWMTREDKPQRVTWDEIHGRRRDGMQWDAPNAEPWKVDDARRVSKWHRLQRSLSVNYDLSDTAEVFRRINVGHAVRVVLGLGRDACAQEVAACGQPDDVAGQRARALAMLAAYERFEAGEKFDQVAADTTPIGDTVPTWTMPKGEPVDTLPRDLTAGDIVAGVYDSFAGSRRLVTAIVGPVQSAPVHTDRRESGEWYTVTIDGEVHEMRSHRWLSVHRKTRVAALPPAEPAGEDTMAVGQCPGCGISTGAPGGLTVVTCAHCDSQVPMQDRPAGPVGFPPVTVIEVPAEPIGDDPWGPLLTEIEAATIGQRAVTA